MPQQSCGQSPLGSPVSHQRGELLVLTFRTMTSQMFDNKMEKKPKKHESILMDPHSSVPALV